MIADAMLTFFSPFAQIFNFLIVLVTPIGFATIRYNTYTVFAVINFAVS